MPCHLLYSKPSDCVMFPLWMVFTLDMYLNELEFPNGLYFVKQTQLKLEEKIRQNNYKLTFDKKSTNT